MTTLAEYAAHAWKVAQNLGYSHLWVGKLYDIIGGVVYVTFIFSPGPIKRDTGMAVTPSWVEVGTDIPGTAQGVRRLTAEESELSKLAPELLCARISEELSGVGDERGPVKYCLQCGHAL